MVSFFFLSSDALKLLPRALGDAAAACRGALVALLWWHLPRYGCRPAAAAAAATTTTTTATATTITTTAPAPATAAAAACGYASGSAAAL